MNPVPFSPNPPDPWRRLAAAACSARPPAAPDLDGFSARVVRRWLAPTPTPAAPPFMLAGWSQLWEAWTLRALAAAGALALAVLAFNFQAMSEDLEPETLSLDPVAELVASL